MIMNHLYTPDRVPARWNRINNRIMAENKNQGQFNIELSEDVAEGVYSNLAVITHSPAEFVIDFIRIMPGVPKSKVKSRIILTPEHAKRFVAALNDNIAKYEAVHGPIREVKGSGPVTPFTFGGPTAQA